MIREGRQGELQVEVDGDGLGIFWDGDTTARSNKSVSLNGSPSGRASQNTTWVLSSIDGVFNTVSFGNNIDLSDTLTAKPKPGPRDTQGSGVFAGAAGSPQLQLIADRSDDANGVLGTLPPVIVRPPAKQPVGETEMESVVGAFFGRLGFEIADTIADSIPIVGQAKGVGELLTGKNALGEDIGVCPTPDDQARWHYQPTTYDKK